MGIYRALVNTKAIVDTTKYITPYKNDILATTWSSLDVNGRTYALPDDTGFCLFGYRSDLFSKAGIGNTPAEVAAAIPDVRRPDNRWGEAQGQNRRHPHVVPRRV